MTDLEDVHVKILEILTKHQIKPTVELVNDFQELVSSVCAEEFNEGYGCGANNVPWSC